MILYNVLLMINILLSILLLASSYNLQIESKRNISEQYVIREVLKDIDPIIDQALEDYDIPGVAIGVVRDGEVIFAKGYGVRDIEKKQPVTTETLFAIGSCTKAFTTLALQMLVEEEKIKWDDPVIEHLPEFRLSDENITQKITIRDLVTHCSGLSRHDDVWYNANLSRKEIVHQMASLEFSHDYHEEFEYSNLMYAVAGELIEKVTGHTWEQVVQKNIFEPLEMHSSNCSVEDSKLQIDHAIPTAKEGKKIKEIPFRNICRIGPAGSINSNIVDMTKWLQFQLSDGKGLIQKSSLEGMHTTQFAKGEYFQTKNDYCGYGLGWFIGEYHDHQLVEHDGAIDGFVAKTSLLLDRNIGLIILTNTEDCAEFTHHIRNVIFSDLL